LPRHAQTNGPGTSRGRSFQFLPRSLLRQPRIEVVVHADLGFGHARVHPQQGAIGCPDIIVAEGHVVEFRLGRPVVAQHELATEAYNAAEPIIAYNRTIGEPREAWDWKSFSGEGLHHARCVETGSRVDAITIRGTENASDRHVLAGEGTACFHVDQRAFPGVTQFPCDGSSPLKLILTRQEEWAEPTAESGIVNSCCSTTRSRAVDIRPTAIGFQTKDGPTELPIIAHLSPGGRARNPWTGNAIAEECCA